MGPQWRERQWGHNLEAAEALRRSREEGFAGWEVTMRFYAAVPLVNGWFERQVWPFRQSTMRGAAKPPRTDQDSGSCGGETGRKNGGPSRLRAALAIRKPRRARILCRTPPRPPGR